MEKNRDESWNEVKTGLSVGCHVSGCVIRHAPYGFFVELPEVEFEGLVQITDIKDVGKVSPSEFPEVGSEIEAVVLGFTDSRSRNQIWLGIKPSQLNLENKPGDVNR